MQTISIILSCGFVGIGYTTVQIQLHIISAINMLSSSLDVNYNGIL